MVTYNNIKDHRGLIRQCDIYTNRKVGCGSCVKCRFFVDADDRGSPTWVKCYGWKPSDGLNRDLIILIDEIKRQDVWIG
jgi:hypothetical protein